jgi:N-ethylmaleimide reductase
MITEAQQTLFTPVQIGPMMLKHRVVMAPLTRSRADQPGDLPDDLMAEYYSQRASDGGLIISEAAPISVTGRGWFGAPGIYTDKQVIGWRKVTSAVHEKGGRMFLQFWHVGRSSHVDMTGGAIPVAPSIVPSYWETSGASISTPSGWSKPSPHRALDAREIPGIVEDYRRAAERAKAAGFDGVEVHAGNGYLLDQFLQDGSNKRTDAYGGSFANRSRFLLEVVRAVASVWDADRVGVRIGPGGTWNGMSDSNSDELFCFVAEQLNQFGLAYLHIIEPRIKGNVTIAADQAPVATERLRRVFAGNIIAAGGFNPQTAEAIVRSGNADLVAFGRNFISNPDLPERIKLKLPLNDYDRTTFFTFDFHGYIDYPFYGEQEPCDMQAGQQWYVEKDKERVAKWLGAN